MISASFPNSSRAFGPGGVTTILGFRVSTKPFHRKRDGLFREL